MTNAVSTADISRLTLLDITGALDVHPPEEPARSLYRNISGFNIGKHVKELSWNSDVLLIASYAAFNADWFSLLHVQNRHVRSDEKSQLAALARAYSQARR